MMQNLMIWRHAEAYEGTPDLQRRLTKKGRGQAAKMSKWLKKNCTFPYQIYTSEATRARETVEHLKHPYTTEALLNPGADLMPIVDFVFAKLADGEDLLVVGHQPWLGQLASYILLNQYGTRGGIFDSIIWSIKKSGIWWFEIKLMDNTDKHYSYYSKVKAVASPG